MLGPLLARLHTWFDRHPFAVDPLVAAVSAFATLNQLRALQTSFDRLTEVYVVFNQRLAWAHVQAVRVHEQIHTHNKQVQAAAALGPDRTEHARQLLMVFAARARRRVDAWLEVLAAEGAVPASDLPRHATVLLALIDGLCLQLLTPEPTTSLRQARELLAEAVERQVFAGRSPAAR
jgi:hypothetical protein